jgi:hypothetical protein
MERKMGLQNHVEQALIEDGFDLEGLGFNWVNASSFELSTSNAAAIESIVSYLFSEVITTGVTVERFSYGSADNCENGGSCQIEIDSNVKFGVIEEWNVHELDPYTDRPLEQCPVFFQKI